jgi:hypothetical protein
MHFCIEKCDICCRYWGFRRVIDVLTGEADLKMLKLGPWYEAWQAARRTQASELVGRMQIM